MKTLVSVVIPVFNGLTHLPALVSGLLNQTYPSLDIVFSEGGGSDGSLDYLRTIDDPRVRVIELPQGTSAAENWTAASQAAKGEYTKLICQDDLLYPSAIEHQVQDIQSNSNAVMAVAVRDIVDAKGKIIFRGRGLAGLSGDVVNGIDALQACYLQGTNVFGEPLAVLFATDSLQRALPWQDDNPLMLDLAMYSKVAPEGTLVLRHKPVGAFRISNSSWSTRLAKEQVEQTRRWQAGYLRTHPQTSTSKARAFAGRHLQTSLRRAAYAYLSARGRLESP